MKNLIRKTITLAAFAALAATPLSLAEPEKHDDHDHAKMVGPNKGKVLHEVHPHAELFVTKDRKLQFTFLTGKGKAAALGEQKIAVVCGKRAKPTRLKFTAKGNSLVSDVALPAGILIPTVIQIKMDPKKKPTIIRLNLNLEQCGDCDSLEYACVCHHHAHEKEKEKPKK